MIRNTLMIFLVFLGVQFWLVMGINLKSNLQIVLKSFTTILLYYFQHYLLVTFHTGNALLILLISIMAIAVSKSYAIRGIKIVSIIVLLSVIGAIANGWLFFYYGQFFGFSIGMATIAAAAGFALVGIERGKEITLSRQGENIE
ncbi:MAG: hypothetical protein ACP5OC_01840 [Thermoplasmata archaeon]